MAFSIQQSMDFSVLFTNSMFLIGKKKPKTYYSICLTCKTNKGQDSDFLVLRSVGPNKTQYFGSVIFAAPKNIIFYESPNGAEGNAS